MIFKNFQTDNILKISSKLPKIVPRWWRFWWAYLNQASKIVHRQTSRAHMSFCRRTKVETTRIYNFNVLKLNFYTWFPTVKVIMVASLDSVGSTSSCRDFLILYLAIDGNYRPSLVGRLLLRQDLLITDLQNKDQPEFRPYPHMLLLPSGITILYNLCCLLYLTK